MDLVFAVAIIATVTIAIAIMAVATTRAGSRHFLIALDGVSNFLFGRSTTQVDSKANVTADELANGFDRTTSFKEATGEIILHNGFAKFIKVSDFFLGRRHTSEVLVAKFFAIGINFFEKLRGFRVLEEQADTSLSCYNRLGISNGIAKCSCGTQNLGCQSGIHIWAY
jgi:hypothetical protein